MQGNCTEPLTSAEARQLGLRTVAADSRDADAEHEGGYQCVLVAEDPAMLVLSPQLWLEGLHVAISRTIASASADFAILEVLQLPMPHSGTPPESPPATLAGARIFITNSVLQGEGRGSARALAAPVDTAALRDGAPPQAVPHALLVQGAHACMHALHA
jgi:hypothetical protein